MPSSNTSALRRQVGQVVAVDADAVADMAAAIVRDAFAPHRLDRGREHVGRAHARPDHLQRAEHAAVQRAEIRSCDLRRRAEVGDARDVGAVVLVAAADVEADHVPARQRVRRRLTFGIALRVPKPMQPITGKASCNGAAMKGARQVSSVTPSGAMPRAARPNPR